MAEEEKKEAAACKTSDTLKTAGKFLAGAALIVVGLLLCWQWRWQLIDLIKGCVGLFLILVGLVFVAIAKE